LKTLPTESSSFCIYITANNQWRRCMKLRREKVLWNVLLGTSVYLLDSLRGRLNEGIDELSDRARDTYSEASRRAGRAMEVVRGEDHGGTNAVAALVVGVGVGVGVGLLLAPASGKETRDTISNKVHQFGDRVRDKFSDQKREPATGTYGA
jgi:ElaB/YqjD/DUF883 family membrane-anchored ribosome-binding protein